MTPATKLMIDRLKDLAARGMSHDEAAAEIGAPRAYLISFVARHKVEFGKTVSKRIASAQEADARSSRMALLYKSGSTLEQIGAEYDITRERVRQILWGEHGIRGQDGGKAITSALRKVERLNKIEMSHQQRHGCSRAQYREILRAGGTAAYTSLKRNAARDGYALEMTLFQWWNIWQASGHWNNRGRGHGYWLFRLRGGNEPLSIKNYCIAPGGEAMRLMRQTEPSRFCSPTAQEAAA